MRKIERNMLTALSNGKDWVQDNTMVIFSDHVGNPYLTASIYLYNNQIAELLPDGCIVPDTDTFKRWPTMTTASRLSALGVHANISKGNAMIDGEVL